MISCFYYQFEILSVLMIMYVSQLDAPTKQVVRKSDNQGYNFIFTDYHAF